MHSEKRALLYRWIIYLCGCVTLSCGIILNTKTGLGVSPLVSISFCVSLLTGLYFSMLTFVLYACFCLLQFPIKGKGRRLSDLLQIPFSIGFTLLLNLFSAGLPTIGSTPGKVVGIILAVVCTGVGISLMVSMQLIPNPADSLAAAIGTASGRGLGFAKNCLDGSCVAITILLGLGFAHRLVGIGIGTVCAVIFTGRVVALFNHLFRRRLRSLAGLSDVG